jgi:hypothetical protein
MDYGVQYWYLSDDDYQSLEATLVGSGYTLASFGTAHEVTSGSFAGWYFDMGEIDTEEMDWLSEHFESFDLRTVNLSVQAGWG